jgi:uncharacterized protein involved in exopolysaccharide biosynthesis
MSGTGVKSSPHITGPEIREPVIFGGHKPQPEHDRQALLLRLLWNRRRFLLQAAIWGLLVSTLVAFLIPASYTSIAQLMPPDNQSSSGLAMMAAMAGSKPGGALAGMAGDLLGLKNSGALFIGVLKSETAQDRIVQQFDLKKIYGVRLASDARKKLDSKTNISEERKSGIISIEVTDHDPNRAAALANAYVEELNLLVAQLSTSAAHRERVFLEERLKVAKQELDEASNQLAQFSSKNTTLDMQTEGKAMLDAAGMLAGELIAAQSELQGLRQIYTDNNARVRALNARVDELRKQLEKLGGANEELKPNTNNRDSDLTAQRAAEPGGDKLAGSPFPTIRKLPLLGAKYSDYYRQAKIQETVFELLTEQYELAKVQEAKETPSVKVLDPGRVPDKKSFPPRLLIISIGTGLVLAAAAFWILGARTWAQVDSADPRKVLALEVASAFQANAPWAPQNGDIPEAWPKRVWRRLGNLFPPSDGPSES